MGVFRQFPYSNFHEMNMDEIIKIVKNMLEEWAQYYAEWDAWMNQMNDDWSNYQEVMNEAWQNMQDFINNYFDNLDVQEEINNKITSMVNTGEFATIVEPYIPPRVTAWLAENITQPVGVVIDTSLSVAGACADAKATGDAIAAVKSDISEIAIIRVNLFNKTNGSYGKYADGTVGSAVELRSNIDYICGWFECEYGKTYTVSQTNYKYVEADENNIMLGKYGSGGDETNYTVTVNNPTAKRIYVSWNRWTQPRKTLDDDMVVYSGGDNSVYVPYGIHPDITDNAIDTSGIARLSDLSTIRTIKQNLFNKANGSTGKYADGTVGNAVELRSNVDYICGWFECEYGKTYTVSQTNYKYVEADENNIMLGKYGSGGDETNYTVTVNNPNAKRIYVSWNRYTQPKKTLDNYMVVYQGEDNSEYFPYGTTIVLTNEIIANSHLVREDEVETHKNYYIGSANYCDYSGLIEALRDLADDTSRKTLYILAGVYDIYTELGGSSYLASITSSSSWRDVSVWIPDNTNIIGLGDVTLNYLPPASDFTNDNQVSCVSVLNLWGNSTIENLKINAQNCRYCIHDEAGSMSTDFVPRRKKYKNLQLKKLANTYDAQSSYISGQAYASGMVDGYEYEYENCYFYSRHNYCWTCHTGGNSAFPAGLRGGQITIKDCVFESPTWAGIRFGSSPMDNAQEYVNVNMNNFYIQNKVLLTTESGTGNAKNHYELHLLNCNDVTIQDDYAINGWTNIYTPTVRNAIS